MTHCAATLPILSISMSTVVSGTLSISHIFILLNPEPDIFFRGNQTIIGIGPDHIDWLPSDRLTARHPYNAPRFVRVHHVRGHDTARAGLNRPDNRSVPSLYDPNNRIDIPGASAGTDIQKSIHLKRLMHHDLVLMTSGIATLNSFAQSPSARHLLRILFFNDISQFPHFPHLFLAFQLTVAILHLISHLKPDYNN